MDVERELAGGGEAGELEEDAGGAVFVEGIDGDGSSGDKRAVVAMEAMMVILVWWQWWQ